MVNRLRINDKIVLVLLTGTVSAGIANIFGYLSRLIHQHTIVMPEAAAELFISPVQVHTLLGFIFGNLMSFTVGGIHAMAFIYILEVTGWRYYWLKSFAITTAGWLIGVGMLFRALNIPSVKEMDLLSSVLFYGAHLVYLTVSAFIVSRYGVPKEREDRL